MQELKNIWKWLKELGHQYNVGQKWARMLMGEMGLEEDMGLEGVLEVVVGRLHQAGVGLGE